MLETEIEVLFPCGDGDGVDEVLLGGIQVTVLVGLDSLEELVGLVGYVFEISLFLLLTTYIVVKIFVLFYYKNGYLLGCLIQVVIIIFFELGLLFPRQLLL